MRLATTRLGRSSKGLRTALAAAPFVVFAMAAGPAQAQRDDPGLQLACADDFFRLCAGVDPGSQEAERCMTRNRPRFSPQCRAAVGTYESRDKGGRK